MMRIAGWIGTVAALALGASWLGGQEVARRTAESLTGPQPPGRPQAEAVAAMGFPLRIGVGIDGLRLAGAPALDLPRVAATAPVWAPLDWTADVALPFTATVSDMRFAISGSAAGVALRAGAAPGWPLRAARIEMTLPAATYEAAAAPSLAADALRLAAEETGAAQYHLTGTVAALRLPQGLAASLTPQARFSDVIEAVTLDAVAGFDHPFTLSAQRPPELARLSLATLRLVWDGRAIAASGDLAIDASGRPEGTLVLTVQDWQAWLEFVTEGFRIDRNLRPLLTMLGNSLAKDGTLTVPLAFRGGRMALGPVPLGPAPVLVQRQ